MSVNRVFVLNPFFSSTYKVYFASAWLYHEKPLIMCVMGCEQDEYCMCGGNGIACKKTQEQKKAPPLSGHARNGISANLASRCSHLMSYPMEILYASGVCDTISNSTCVYRETITLILSLSLILTLTTLFLSQPIDDFHSFVI